MRNHAVHNIDGNTIGGIKNGWLTKSVDPLIHKLRSPAGWATDKAHIDMLTNTNGKGIILKLPNGELLQASTKLFLDHGIEINRGHGPQIVLPEKWWTSSSQGNEDAWQTKFPVI